jgi:hypothetical protein
MTIEKVIGAQRQNQISLSLPDLFRQSMASPKLAFSINAPIVPPNPNSHARVNPINTLSVTVRF